LNTLKEKKDVKNNDDDQSQDSISVKARMIHLTDLVYISLYVDMINLLANVANWLDEVRLFLFGFCQLV
jgi:hypothetical protein